MAISIPPGPGIVAELYTPYPEEEGLQGLRELYALDTLNRVLGGMLFHVANTEIPMATSHEELLRAQAKISVIRDFRDILEGLSEQEGAYGR
jgi:hypothetical protein